MELIFRTLNANEIECKAAVVGRHIEISLHVQAATCTRMLNEKVGAMNWEKEYTNGNKNCVVRIWDIDKKMMISKEDCGGSLTEIDGYKGQASNGFKRVCALGWGLGIELYSQPTILLPTSDNNISYDEKNNPVVIEKYSVKEIEYNEDKLITRVVIVDSNGNHVYDGPNANGESVITPVIEDEPELVIPENADMLNNEDVVEDCDNDLPDNTDGFDEMEDDNTPPFTVDYRKDLEAEIKRTHVKRADVLKVLKINSFEELNMVEDSLVESTLNKLRAMPTFAS